MNRRLLTVWRLVILVLTTGLSVYTIWTAVQPPHTPRRQQHTREAVDDALLLTQHHQKHRREGTHDAPLQTPHKHTQAGTHDAPLQTPHKHTQAGTHDAPLQTPHKHTQAGTHDAPLQTPQQHTQAGTHNAPLQTPQQHTQAGTHNAPLQTPHKHTQAGKHDAPLHTSHQQHHKTPSNAFNNTQDVAGSLVLAAPGFVSDEYGAKPKHTTIGDQNIVMHPLKTDRDQEYILSPSDSGYNFSGRKHTNAGDIGDTTINPRENDEANLDLFSPVYHRSTSSGSTSNEADLLRDLVNVRAPLKTHMKNTVPQTAMNGKQDKKRMLFSPVAQLSTAAYFHENRPWHSLKNIHVENYRTVDRLKYSDGEEEGRIQEDDSDGMVRNEGGEMKAEKNIFGDHKMNDGMERDEEERKAVRDEGVAREGEHVIPRGNDKTNDMKLKEDDEVKRTGDNEGETEENEDEKGETDKCNRIGDERNHVEERDEDDGREEEEKLAKKNEKEKQKEDEEEGDEWEDEEEKEIEKDDDEEEDEDDEEEDEEEEEEEVEDEDDDDDEDESTDEWDDDDDKMKDNKNHEGESNDDETRNEIKDEDEGYEYEINEPKKQAHVDKNKETREDEDKVEGSYDDDEYEARDKQVRRDDEEEEEEDKQEEHSDGDEAEVKESRNKEKQRGGGGRGNKYENDDEIKEETRKLHNEGGRGDKYENDDEIKEETKKKLPDDEEEDDNREEEDIDANDEAKRHVINLLRCHLPPHTHLRRPPSRSGGVRGYKGSSSTSYKSSDRCDGGRRPAGDVCRAAQVMVVKVSGMSLASAALLLNHLPDLKLVHLLRLPSTLSHRAQPNMCTTTTPTTTTSRQCCDPPLTSADPTRLACDLMAKDLALVPRLRQLYPDRYRLFLDDDFLLHPRIALRNLGDFLGLRFTHTILQEARRRLTTMQRSTQGQGTRDQHNHEDGKYSLGDQKEGRYNLGDQKDRRYNLGDQKDGMYSYGDQKDGRYNFGDQKDRRYNLGDQKDGRYNLGDQKDGRYSFGDQRHEYSMDRFTDQRLADQKYLDHMDAGHQANTDQSNIHQANTDQSNTHQANTDQSNTHQANTDQSNTHQANTDQRNARLRSGYKENGYRARKKVATKIDEEVQSACSALFQLLEFDPIHTQQHHHRQMTPSLATHPS
ncbi:hypothetical protein Pmani_021178 [Petrolisthes manimaculis]|uniref:Uncharacterized protein n=1 Tax=Petrolisthes manimaculis TaxID=1843537 RepID=A0AAE1PEQ6_9EUCA|nr:hypothetical protein Pmani_021178 [Petrolisthes manimaculis]